jgi:MSHA biogenesis protein MshO
MKTRGFTLVELIMVIAVIAVIAAGLTAFLKPAIDSYLDSRRRADLTDIADTALRRMAQDVRTAVPNSVVGFNSNCFYFVPTSTGGRYRMAVDTVNPNTSIALDPTVPIPASATTIQFDVLSPMQTAPNINDWVVINNQNGGDVYATGVNRSQITAIQTPAATAGTARLTINKIQFSPGYDGGRFVVVPNATQVIVYNVVGFNLYRTVSSFAAVATPNVECARTDGALLATDVASSTFVYTPNQGATQQSGFIWMRLEIARSSESAALAYGVHVSNVP